MTPTNETFHSKFLKSQQIRAGSDQFLSFKILGKRSSDPSVADAEEDVIRLAAREYLKLRWCGLNHDRGVVAGGVSDRLRILEGVLKLLILRGSFFRFRAVLDQFRSILGIFRAHFSYFYVFSSLEARVSKATKSRLMYSPSENRVEAGQLGSKGYRVVQTVDLALNAWFRWV
jgi:hypothetical protein